jgi:hypothetical protein
MIRSPTIQTVAPHEWGTYKELRRRARADLPDAPGRTRADDPSHLARDGHQVDHTGSMRTSSPVTIGVQTPDVDEGEIGGDGCISLRTGMGTAAGSAA